MRSTRGEKVAFATLASCAAIAAGKAAYDFELPAADVGACVLISLVLSLLICACYLELKEPCADMRRNMLSHSF